METGISYHMGSADQSQVARHASKHFYPLSPIYLLHCNPPLLLYEIESHTEALAGIELCILGLP